MLFQNGMFLSSLEHKRRMVVTKQLTVAIGFHSIFFHTAEVKFYIFGVTVTLRCVVRLLGCSEGFLALVESFMSKNGPG